MRPVLPHAPPMHWLDSAALSVDGRTIIAARTIGQAHPFILAGYLLPAALVELMAQCAAAGSALDVQAHSRKVGRGMLVAIQQFESFAPVPVGTTLTLTATREQSFAPFTKARITAQIGTALVASATMTFHLEFE